MDFVLQSVESLDVDQGKGTFTMSFYQGFEHPWILDPEGPGILGIPRDNYIDRYGQHKQKLFGLFNNF